jgi:hypothetical protein
MSYNESIEYLYSVVFPSFRSSKEVDDEVKRRCRKETEAEVEFSARCYDLNAFMLLDDATLGQKWPGITKDCIDALIVESADIEQRLELLRKCRKVLRKEHMTDDSNFVLNAINKEIQRLKSQRNRLRQHISRLTAVADRLPARRDVIKRILEHNKRDAEARLKEARRKVGELYRPGMLCSRLIRTVDDFICKSMLI